MITKDLMLKVPVDASTRKVKLLVAAELFKEGEITLKQASELTELTVWDLLHEFGRLKVSFTNIDVDDLREELEAYE